MKVDFVIMFSIKDLLDNVLIQATYYLCLADILSWCICLPDVYIFNIMCVVIRKLREM